MDYYRKNMRIIKRNYKYIYNQLKKYETSDIIDIKKFSKKEDIIAEVTDKENNIKIYIEATKTDNYTMRIKNEESDIYFHSKYNPVREANGLIKNFKVKKEKQVIALGFGLAYHLNELASRNQFEKIIIIEPYISIFYTALNFIDLSTLLKNKRLVFIINGNLEIFDVINRNISLSLSKELAFLEQAPSLKLFDSDYDKIYKEIKEAINYKKISLASDIQQARKWRNNIIINLSYIFKNPKADDFFGTFEGIPAICVSAGPSLDKNIEEIKNAEGKALIMCVGTALKALLKHNINPDIVVSIDGNEANYKHFKDIAEIPDTYLFAEMGNHYRIQSQWNDKQAFFTMKRNFSGWVEKLKGEYTPIKTGGTVAHSMVDLAYKLGADPIVLVGQDLAYAEGRTHARGTTYEGQKAENNKMIEVEGISGDTVLTSKSFLSMLSYFNNYFSKHPDRTYIDATEGGAKINHTQIISLKEAIEIYVNNVGKVNVKEKLEKVYLAQKPDWDRASLELNRQMEDTLDQLNNTISISKEQLSFVKSVEKKLKYKENISDRECDEIEKELLSYENELKNNSYIKYFIERILIIESMKYEEVKGSFYIDKKQGFEEKMKYYRTYRVNYLKELEKGKKLMMKVYSEYNDENIDADSDIEREGLA